MFSKNVISYRELSIIEKTSNILRNMEDPYRVELDTDTNTWRILYLHHPELSLITDIDQDVPDDRPI